MPSKKSNDNNFKVSKQDRVALEVGRSGVRGKVGLGGVKPGQEFVAEVGPGSGVGKLSSASCAYAPSPDSTYL